MTLHELIEQLQDMADEFGGDTEVRLAEQPSYPFEYAIAGIVYSTDLAAAEDEDETPAAKAPDVEPGIVYIVEGTQLRYASKRIWRGI
jgi:hypothetical protein